MARREGLLWIVALFAMPLLAVNGAFGDEMYGDGDDPVVEAQVDDELQEDAEEAEVADDSERADESEPRMRGRRDRGSRGGAARSRSARLLESFRDELTRALELEEEAADEMREVFDEYIKPLNEKASQVASDRRDQASELREMVAELREAQRDGDRERVEELREQITQSRKSQNTEEVPFDELVDELVEFAYEDQMDTFDRIVEKYEKKLSPGKKKADPLQLIRKALAGINLSTEQREATREIFTDFNQAAREARGDEDRLTTIAEELRDAIEYELDDEQATQFAERLERLETASGTKEKKTARATRTISPEVINAGVSGADEEAAEGEVLIDEYPYDDEPAPE